MKIIVISDTHRDFNSLHSIVKANTDADMLIHLGDGEREFADVSALYPELPMVYVCGNCDFDDHERSHIAIASGLRIFCCHGHMYHVREGLEYLIAEARRNDCSIALYGHTHLYRTEQIGGVFVMNPGSPSQPRGGNGPTYGVITINGDGMVGMEIRSAEDNTVL